MTQRVDAPLQVDPDPGHVVQQQPLLSGHLRGLPGAGGPVSTSKAESRKAIGSESLFPWFFFSFSATQNTQRPAHEVGVVGVPAVVQVFQVPPVVAVPPAQPSGLPVRPHPGAGHGKYLGWYRKD